MKTNMTFVLVGFNFENYAQSPMMRVMRERGFNIVRHHPETDARNIRFLTYQNNRPTVVIDVMSDKDREIYFDIPAIHMSDFTNATVRKGDHFLGSNFTLAQFDEIIYGLADEEEEEPETSYEEDDEDDYAPIAFSSNGCGYYGYNEAFDML
ncbi:hypothetical protein ABIV32_001537 [Salmonella enterica subsp. enterica]